jgi:hypothetical protein
MKNKAGVIIVLSFVALFIMTSCASTKLTTVWRDDNFNRHLKKVLVIGISKEEGKKRFFETAFASKLKEQGTAALQSFTIFPYGEILKKEVIVSKVREMDIDAVLVTRLVEKKTVETYFPGPANYRMPSYYNNYYGYYSGSYRSGAVVESEVVVLETNLYDAETEDIIWSAMSETFMEKSSDKLIEEFIDLIIDDLSKSNIIDNL